MSIHVWGTPPEDEPQPTYQYEPVARPKMGCFEMVIGIFALGCGILILAAVGFLAVAVIVSLF